MIFGVPVVIDRARECDDDAGLALTVASACVFVVEVEAVELEGTTALGGVWVLVTCECGDFLTGMF